MGGVNRHLGFETLVQHTHRPQGGYLQIELAKVLVFCLDAHRGNLADHGETGRDNGVLLTQPQLSRGVFGANFVESHHRSLIVSGSSQLTAAVSCGKADGPQRDEVPERRLTGFVVVAAKLVDRHGDLLLGACGQ